jgi:hypothetical protein
LNYWGLGVALKIFPAKSRRMANTSLVKKKILAENGV